MKDEKRTCDTVAELHEAVAALPASWRDLDMLKLLKPAMKALPDLLNDRKAWQSKYIDYEEPYLMRLSHQIDAKSRDEPSRKNSVRVNLHYFFAKTDEEICPYSDLINPYADNKDRIVKAETAQLYHPHPWAAGFVLFEGSYTQHIGHAKKPGVKTVPPVAETRTQDAADKATASFAFNDPLIWHCVMPQNTAPVCTMMVSYTPEDWNQPSPTSPHLRALGRVEENFMFATFKHLTDTRKYAGKRLPQVS